MTLEQRLLALAEQVGEDIGELQRANESFMSDTDIEVAKRWPRNQQWAAGAFTRWAFALPQGVPSLDALTLDLNNLTNIQTLYLRLWLRPVGSASVTAPSVAQGDTQVAEYSYPSLDFPQVATHQAITFRFPEYEVPAGQWLMFELYGVKADASAANIGLGRVDGIVGITQYERGYSMTTGPAWALVLPSGATPAIAYIASLAGKVLDGSQFVNLPRPAVDPLSALVLTPDAISLSYEGLSVAVEGRVLRDRTAVRIGTTLSATAAATGQTTSTVNLFYATTDVFFRNNANVWLGRRNISNVVVKRSSDAVTLVEGVDYSVNYSNGKLRGIINKAAFNVDVTFSWAQERYDLIQIDEQTNVLSLKTGTPRDFDPQEYLVGPDAYKIPVARVRVVGGAVREIIPVYKFDGLVERGTEAEWYRLQSRNRHAIRKTLGKLARGERVKVAGYGDSITAFQTGAPTDGSQYQANGQWRDRDRYFVLYPSDTQTAKLQYFDTGDGAGAVHIRKGWNWTLVEHWRKAYGDIVDYLNFGIASTASANVANGGLWPARLAPIISAAPDLCVIAFGINEMGQYITRDNVASIITQLQAVGTECVVVGVPQIAPDNDTTVDRWRITNHALRMAAWDTGCAYVPFTAISDTDGGLAGLGVSKKHVSSSNLYDHPGFYELEKYGELLVFALGEKDAAGGLQTIASVSGLQTALNSKANSADIDFTIIYPNGGSESAPANVAINSRYTIANPFPGYKVRLEAELYYNGEWSPVGWVYLSGDSTYGTCASQVGDTVYVQTGNTSIAPSYVAAGVGAFSVNQVGPLPCRVLVWKIKGATA